MHLYITYVLFNWYFLKILNRNFINSYLIILTIGALWQYSHFTLSHFGRIASMVRPINLFSNFVTKYQLSINTHIQTHQYNTYTILRIYFSLHISSPCNYGISFSSQPLSFSFPTKLIPKTSIFSKALDLRQLVMPQ